MNASPRVAVVIPVLNRADSVCRAIASVLQQTVQDFELIVVDDGSTDDTPAALAAIADERLRVIRHPQRRGGSAARNTGVRASSASLIAFLDSDDEWEPTKLARQLEVFGSLDDRVAMVYTGATLVYADVVVQHLPAPAVDLARQLLIENVVGGTSVAMVRRAALAEVGGFDEELTASQELDLWFRICERFTAVCIPEPLVRMSSSSGDRISANVSATTKGKALFRRKHAGKMAQLGVMHLHLQAAAWWYLRVARNPTAARRSAHEAVAANPIDPRGYLLVIVTWTPLAWLDRFASWKHIAAPLLERWGVTALRNARRVSIN